MLERDNRVTDSSLLASQERVVGFFASTTLILLAAVFTAMSASSLIADMANQLPFDLIQTTEQVQFKLVTIVTVLVYAFFMITWSLRQYGFAAVMMGSAPTPDETIDPEVSSTPWLAYWMSPVTTITKGCGRIISVWRWCSG